MLNFKKRSSEPEILDDFNLQGHDLELNLRELEKVNKLLGGYQVTIDGIKEAMKGHDSQTWRIIDAGCGGGDTLVKIASWARSTKVDVQLTGIDANSSAVQYAMKQAGRTPNLRFKMVNILSPQFLRLPADLVTFNLFLHHFSDEEIVDFLIQCRRKNSAIVINDLHRNQLAYHLFRLVSRIFRFSSIGRHDGKLSVKKSFVKKDWERLFARAGIENYSIKWRWAFRWLCVVNKETKD